MSAQARPIGVITAYLGGYYFGAMLRGVYQACREAGIPVIVVLEELGQRMPTLGADQVAGWIALHPLEDGFANLNALCATGVPVVTAPIPLHGVACTQVQVDNRGGMRAAVRHLIEHGHQRIAYVDHGPDLWSRQRYRGYCDALDDCGIARDPTLVMRQDIAGSDGVDVQVQRGETAIRQLLERGMPCTALAAATDACALAAMRTFQAAGGQIPGDLAVVGFDDLVEAQYATPPLTTVRCTFAAIGRAAVEQLFSQQGNGQAQQPQDVAVQTTLLHRRSCGCNTLNQLVTQDGAMSNGSANWQGMLAQQLAQVVRYPLPPDPALAPSQLWADARKLVAWIDDTVHGQPAPLPDEIANVWRQALAQTESLEVLQTAETLLEDAAEQQLVVAAAPARRPAIIALLRQMRLEMARALLAQEVAPKQQLNIQLRANYEISMALLRAAGDEAQALGWLDRTTATWGCLGLWAAPDDRTATLEIAGAYDRDTPPQMAIGQRICAHAFPPLELLPLRAQHGVDMTVLCPIRTETRDWGMLAVCGAAEPWLQIEGENVKIQATLLGATLDRNMALAALTAQQTTLQAAYDRERTLSQTIRELGCPIIPLLPGVLLVPLIGAIDSQRAQQIISAVLEAVTAQRARAVLLDVTAVPMIDTQVANALIQTAHAAKLIGAQVVMVGIRPEIAQSIIGLGIDLKHLRIHGTLASAISRLQLQRNV